MQSGRLLLLALLLGCFVLTTKSQSTTWKKQVGVDITPLTTRVLNFGGTASGQDFSFILRNNKEGNKGNRYGLGLNFNINPTGNNFTQLRLRASAGAERRKRFGKVWEGYLGWDFRLAVDYQRFGNINQDNSSTEIDLGPAVVLGMNFWLNDHLILSTEGALPVLVRINTGFDDGVGVVANWELPVALFLSYRW